MAKSYIIAGLGYGDEGKGTIVDFLAKDCESVVRYNGGPQAAHHVVQNGVFHCFSQFGSGTFLGKKTYLSKNMLVDPLALIVEGDILVQKGVKNCYDLLFIDEDCVVITPMQKYVGRMREVINRHGSCGMGFGETIRDRTAGLVLRVKDLYSDDLEHKLDFMWRVKLDQAEQLVDERKDLAEIYNKINQEDLVDNLCRHYQKFAKKIKTGNNYEAPAVFEGAHGVLLDVEHGFWPHVTKTKTTFEHAQDLINEEVEKIGILRAYSTRHGAGPFVTEDKTLKIPELHNKTNEWQGEMRIGWFDAVAARYALDVIGGVDYLAITNLDRLNNERKVCVAYEKKGERIYSIEKPEISDFKPIYEKFTSENSFLNFIERELKTPIKILSYGPERKDKKIIFECIQK